MQAETPTQPPERDPRRSLHSEIGTGAFRALIRDPGLAVLIRPDRVIAGLGAASLLPRPSWSVPAAGDFAPSRDSSCPDVSHLNS